MTETETLKIVRRILSTPVPDEPLFKQVAQTHPSHMFLTNLTGQIYQRQVALVRTLLQTRFDRPPEKIRILDWGCGKGQITHLLKAAGFDVTSADVAAPGYQIDDSAFRQETPLIQHNNVSVVPLEHEYILPFPDASFDCVLSFGVLEHVPNETESLKELRRVAAPGALFFIAFLPRSFSWTQRLAHLRGDFYHNRLYTKTQLRRMLAAAGFSIDAEWEGQLFPKNKLKLLAQAENIDRFLTNYTPLKLFSTNIEAIATAV
jgi:2-polyprenyl-3-methyl-5-hydroxy-6-metoxy-1,4-benzoquinol methylase